MHFFPRWAVLLALFAVSLAAFENKVVSSVEIAGPHPSVELESKAGEQLDQARVQRDVKHLWATGRFEDVRVESVEEPDGVRLTFHVTAKSALRLRNVIVEPPLPGTTAAVPPGRLLDAAAAQQLATEVRKQLVSQGYPEATAEAEIVPAGPGQADVRVKTVQGQHARVEVVQFSGDLAAKPDDLRKALRATKPKTMIPGIPGLWGGWKMRPDYSEDGVHYDIANLRDFYYKRGYFDASVTVDSVSRNAGSTQVDYWIAAGPRFAIRSVNLQGASGTRAIAPGKKGEFPLNDLCRALIGERREAEKAGVVDFGARMEVRDVETAGGRKQADVFATVERGPALRVGRIEFRGNRALSDTSIRRSMMLDEGQPLDQMLVRKSLARINRTNLFEPLSPANVVVNTPPGSDVADITINLKERKRGMWNFSGPMGPMSIAGPLQFAISSRLPPWGRHVFELSTYTASLSLMAFASPMSGVLPFLPKNRFLMLFTLTRPQLPGQRFLSGFTIAPQLGWQGMLFGYGMAQSRDLLGSVLQSERDFTPPLPVTVVRPGQPDGVMYCELPSTKLDKVKKAGSVATNLLFAFSPL